MQLIESSVGLIDIKDPFEKIETVGRICYKSSPKGQPKDFYKNLCDRGHYAMVEHATFVFDVSERVYYSILNGDPQRHKFLNFTRTVLSSGGTRCLVSGNLRALNDTDCVDLVQALYLINPLLVYNAWWADWMENHPITDEDRKLLSKVCNVVDLDTIEDLTEEEWLAHKYLSFHFICDRGVSHEIVRHRPASYAQESTRYCNYSKEKFGSEITCIKPANFDNWGDYERSVFIDFLEDCERAYMKLLKYNHPPQEGRAVLPNALKTEIVMTANCGEFEHFFNLRSRGLTGAPHPDMKIVADKALQIYYNLPKPFIKCVAG